MVHYKLHYFPARGRCEFIRYILEYTQTPYDSHVITFEEWGTGGAKKTMPLGYVPVLELDDGRQLSQSLCIARYLARKHGLTHSDEFQEAWGDQIAACVEDIYPRHYVHYVRATLVEKDPEKQKTAWENMKKDGVIPLFEKFEQLLGDKKYFCGEKVHWSDLVVAEFVDRTDVIFEKGFPARFPKLQAHCKRIHELPQIKKYVEKRGTYHV